MLRISIWRALRRLNQIWAMDITCISMAKVFVYLAVVLDWFLRRVLAWRLSITMEAAFCVDAVAESTFICDYYLGFRGVADRARTIPLDQIESILKKNRIDIVTNIESFAECTVQSITWWLDLLEKYEARYFMIAIEGESLLSREVDGSRIEFQPLIEQRGFELIAREPIYGSATSVAAYGLYPNRLYFLFRNKSMNPTRGTDF